MRNLRRDLCRNLLVPPARGVAVGSTGGAAWFSQREAFQRGEPDRADGRVQKLGCGEGEVHQPTAVLEEGEAHDHRPQFGLLRRLADDCGDTGDRVRPDGSRREPVLPEQVVRPVVQRPVIVRGAGSEGDDDRRVRRPHDGERDEASGVGEVELLIGKLVRNPVAGEAKPSSSDIGIVRRLRSAGWRPQLRLPGASCQGGSGSLPEHDGR